MYVVDEEPKKCKRCEEEKPIGDFIDEDDYEWDICADCGEEQAAWEETQAFDYKNNR